MEYLPRMLETVVSERPITKGEIVFFLYWGAAILILGIINLLFPRKSVTVGEMYQSLLGLPAKALMSLFGWDSRPEDPASWRRDEETEVEALTREVRELRETIERGKK